LVDVLCFHLNFLRGWPVHNHIIRRAAKGLLTH
jgi:hypothetical protein